MSIKRGEEMNSEKLWTRLSGHQIYADRGGYGPAWAKMCNERTPTAAKATELAIISESQRSALPPANLCYAADAARAVALSRTPATIIKWIERAEEL